MEPTFKLVTSNDKDLFEQRLNRFAASLGADDVIVDIKFSTSHFGEFVEFSALVHYQKTEAWGDD